MKQTSEWKKCQKKPIVVEYREPLPINNIYENGDITKPMKGELIATLEGVEVAIVGQHFVIKGVEGEFYPIRKDIFHKTYDIVKGA